jgi:hypothetical protein
MHAEGLGGRSGEMPLAGIFREYFNYGGIIQEY